MEQFVYSHPRIDFLSLYIIPPAFTVSRHRARIRQARELWRTKGAAVADCGALDLDGNLGYGRCPATRTIPKVGSTGPVVRIYTG